jgi:ribosomal RNA-processing protein 8
MAGQFAKYFQNPAKHIIAKPHSSGPEASSHTAAEDAKSPEKKRNAKASRKEQRMAQKSKDAIQHQDKKKKKHKKQSKVAQTQVPGSKSVQALGHIKQQTPDQTQNAKMKMKTKMKASRERKGVGEGLQGGKFRWLNEQLYTHQSKESHELFKSNRSLFQDYHTGYAAMMAKWPKNPLDLIIKELSKSKYAQSTILDLGCGTGRLAQTLVDRKVSSFDLVSLSPFVTECDIAHVTFDLTPMYK